MDRIGHILNIPRVETSHTDAPISSQVDLVVGGKLLHHVWEKSGIGEHTDLVHNVGPVMYATLLSEMIHELITHQNDAISHHLDVRAPLCEKLWVSEDGVYNPSAVEWRVAVDWTGKDLDL
jgi:hypothetical protein